MSGRTKATVYKVRSYVDHHDTNTSCPMPATTRSSPTPVTSARDSRTARKATAGVSCGEGFAGFGGSSIAKLSLGAQGPGTGL